MARRCTRQLAAAEKDKNRQATSTPARARTTASFSTSPISQRASARRLAFHFIGFGIGSRSHADRQGAYDSLRSSGFLGLCLSEQKVGNPLQARDVLPAGARHSPNDPIAYFLLGNVNRDIYNVRQSCDYLKAAAPATRGCSRSIPISTNRGTPGTISGRSRHPAASSGVERKCALLLSSVLVVAALAQGAGLKIVVVAGEDAVNIIQQRTAVAPIVEVRDRNDLPVAGVAVVFAVRGGGASFAGGSQTVTVTTNAAGRATASGLTPTGNGAIQINVTATSQGQTATASISQTNFSTVQEAARAGRTPGPSNAAAGAAAGATAGVAAGTAVAGAGAGAGGGMSGTTIAVIAGAGVAGAVVAKKAFGGSSAPIREPSTFPGRFKAPCQSQVPPLANSCAAGITYSPARCDWR